MSVQVRGSGTIGGLDEGLVVSGIVTATTFAGALTGNVTGNISGGTVAGSTGTFTGEVTIPTWLVHAGDSNTKFGFEGPDTITFETAGSERARITSAGNIGIGDNSPGNLLTVAGRTETRSITGHAGTNTDLDIASGHASSNIKFYVGQYGVSADEKVRITSAGKVGINTNNPLGDMLTVCEFNSGTEIYENIALRLQGSSGQNVALQFTDTTGAAAYIAVQGDALRLGTNNAERLRISSDGKIHTGDPASLATDDFNITATGTGATLSLNRAKTGNASDNDLLGAVSFQSYPAGQGYASAEAAIRSYAESGQSGSAAPTDLRFYTKPSTTGPGASPNERLRIDSSGYVTTPSNVMFEVTTNGGQNLTNQTREKVTFNNVVNQRGISFDTSNYRFTAPVAGYYHFDLFIYTYYTKFVECDSRINGASTGSKIYRLTTYRGPNDQNPCPIMGSWTQYLAKDDYVEQYIYVETTHSTHRYIYGDTNRKPTWWCGYLVG